MWGRINDATARTALGRIRHDRAEPCRSPSFEIVETFFVSISQDTTIMFYAIGLGLADEKDVSVKGLEIIKRAERVYLEAYTAVLLVEKEVLVRLISFCFM